MRRIVVLLLAKGPGKCRGGCGRDHRSITNDEKHTRNAWEAKQIANGQKIPYTVKAALASPRSPSPREDTQGFSWSKR
eukprot:12934073-Prorocentrum_lima.AAC.1